MRRPTAFRIAAAGALALAIAAVSPGWAKSGATAKFGAPVQITPAGGGGYEPGIYADRFGNLYSTAHKENWQLALGPDSRSQTQTRSMSWTWWSSDGGKTWKNLPMGPAEMRNHEFGDEGDMAFDDRDNLYFVDTTVADITLTSWHIGQNGPEFTYNTPVVGTGNPVDDRPWVTAHLNQHVFYFANEGDKRSYPAGSTSAGPGSGPGRYTVYRSTDGGQSFDRTGVTLDDSGWCRPAAAHNSKFVYAICTNDGGADDAVHNAGEPGYEKGTIWSYVSPDDGLTWYRHRVTGYNAKDSWFTYPNLEVARDGSLWAFYLDGQTPKCEDNQCTPTSARMVVMHSTDNGKHWTTYDATPAGAQAKWQYRYAWMAVSKDSKTLGLAVFGRPYDATVGADKQAAWRVYGSVFRAGQRPALVSLDQKHPVSPAGFSSPPGDFLMSSFDTHGKFHAAWTRVVTTADTPAASAYVYRDIYTVAQR
jgi:hypothetical protein